MGYSIEDVALATGLMGNASIKGSMAGTALRSTFTRLVKPPKDAAAALDALGVSATNSDGTMKPFRQTLGDLRKSFKGLSDAQKAEYAASIAGQEAMAGFLAMMNASDADFDKLQNRIDTAKDKNLLGEIQQTMGDNLKGAVKSFESAKEGLQIAIGDAFEVPLKNLTNALASNLGLFAQWVGKHHELVQVAGAVAAAISAVIVGLAGYGVAAAGVEVLAANFAALKAGALESAAAQRISQAMSASWTGIYNSIADSAKRAAQSVRTFFVAQTLADGTQVGGIKNSLKSLATSFLNVGRAAWSFAISPVGVALMALAAAGYYCYTHWSQVGPVFEMLASVIGGSLATAIQTLSPAFSSMSESASRMGPAFAAVGKIIFQVFAVGANVVIRFAALLITSLGNSIKTIMDLFSGLGNVIASALAGDFSGAMKHASKTWDGFKENLSKGISDASKGMSDLAKNWNAPLTIMAHHEAIDNRRTQETETRNADVAKSLSTAIESFKQANSDKDVSKISEAVNAVVDKVKQDPKADIAPLLKEVFSAAEATKKENPNVDVSKLSEAVTAAIEKVSAVKKEQDQGAEMVKAVSTAIESLKKEKPDADFSKIEAAISAAVEKSDSPKAIAEAVSTAIESSRKENPELDLSKISEAIAAVQKEQNGGAELAQSLSTAIESLKQQNSEADFSKIEAAISAAVEKSSSKEDLAAALSTAIESVKQEQPELDLTPITEAIASVQESQAVQTQESQINIDQLGNSASQTGQKLAETQENISQFDAALPTPIEGLNNLGSTSGTTAGSLQSMADAAGQVASALSAKAQEISSIKISAPSVGAVAANAMGGIYSKGAFLTTFAEKSPEAAIPIDNSQRAIDLWTKTGQMLGTLPGKSFAEQRPPQAQQMSTLERAQRKRLEQVRVQYEAAKKAGEIHSIAIESSSEMSKAERVARQKLAEKFSRGQGVPEMTEEELKDLPPELQEKLRRLQEAQKHLPHQKNLPRQPRLQNLPKKLPSAGRSKDPFFKLEEILKNLPRGGKGNPTFDIPKTPISRLPKTPATPPRTDSTRVEYDKLGNIKGLDGLSDNIITKDDDVQVAREKKAAQMEEWRKKSVAKTPAPLHSIPVESKQLPRSIYSGGVNLPMTQTLPRTVDVSVGGGGLFSGGGLLSAITDRISATSGGGIFSQLEKILPQSESSSPIDLHFEINIAGNANAEDVENGIRQSIPLLEETFEQKLANHQHELQRRSFG